MTVNYTVAQLQAWTQGEWFGATSDASFAVNGFNNDTRNLKQEEGFVALKTPRRDGHLYLEDAVKAGAGLALVERVQEAVPIAQLKVKNSLKALQEIAKAHRLEFPGQVIGITGSCGKTSTKDLIGNILGDAAWVTAGNHNNFLGVPLTLTRLDAAKHRYAVVEAGISERGEMDVLAEMIQPDIAVVTMVGPTHLENLLTIENIATEKAKIAKTLQAGGRVVFPVGCLEYAAFQDFESNAYIVCPEGEMPEGACKENYLIYKTKTDARAGCRLVVESAAHGQQAFEIPQMSRGMLSNACIAIATAHLCGVEHAQIQRALSEWKPSSMRGEIRVIGDQHFYVDCYNASPNSMVDAFEVFAQAMPEDLPRLYILGCMAELGVSSHELHFETGCQLKLRPQDRAIVIGTQSTALCEGIIEAGNQCAQVSLYATLSEIAQEVKNFNGAILLKGSRRYSLEKILPSV